MAINRVLLYNDGLLHNWINDYKKNGYNIVTKPIGRPRKNSTMKKKNNNLNPKDKKIQELEEQLLRARAENTCLKSLRELDEQDEKKQK